MDEKNLEDYLDQFSQDSLINLHKESIESDKPSLIDEITQIEQQHINFKLLGEGATKKVSQATDLALRIDVAYAEPKKSLSGSSKEAFLKEARLTAKLQHPNIISILSIGLNDGQPYFTMELKDGQTLAEYLNISHLELEQAIEVFIKICDAISYAHSKDILHLDLKPENIQITQAREVLVCDWGLGHSLNAEHYLEDDHDLSLKSYDQKTIHGQIKGSPGFIAPEQINGQEKNKSTDVYGLGCLLYYLTTHQTAFSGTVEKQLQNALEGNFLKPTQINPKISPALESIILKCLQLDPLLRYSSATELLNDLRAMLANYPTLAQNPNLIERSALGYKRHKSFFNYTCSILILLISFAVFSYLQFKESYTKIQKEKDIAEAHRIKAEHALNEYKILETKKNSIETNLNSELKKNLSNLFLNNTKIEPVLEELEKTFKNKEQQEEYHLLKFNYLFYAQKYNAAVQSIDQYFKLSPIKDYLNQRRSLAIEYSKLKPDSEILTAEQMEQLLIKVDDKFTAYRCSDYYIRNISDFESRVSIFLKVLEKENPKWKKDYHYSKGHGERHFELHGEELKSLCFYKDLTLKHLNITSLDVSHSGLKDFNKINQIRNLEKLNIAFTAITDFKSIQKMKKLKELTLHKNQLSSDQENKLSQHLTIKYEE